MKWLAAVLTFIGLHLATANANVNGPLEYFKIHFSAKSGSIQVLGRIMPNLGAFQVERAETSGRVLSVLHKEGEHVQTGTPLLKISGAACATRPAACTVLATHEGVISEILRHPGAEVEEGDSVVNILNPGGISVRLDVPEKYVKFISAGEGVEVRFSHRPAEKFETKILDILPPVGLGDTTRGVRLKPFKPPIGTRLESLVNAELPVPMSGPGAQVPATAVGFFGGRHFVVKRSGETLSAVPVRILSETRETLWIRPVAEGHIADGDLILGDRAIYFLPGLLGEKPE